VVTDAEHHLLALESALGPETLERRGNRVRFKHLAATHRADRQWLLAKTQQSRHGPVALAGGQFDGAQGGEADVNADYSCFQWGSPGRGVPVA
jgi:hypothetical protein